jgi:hypothetical protein
MIFRTNCDKIYLPNNRSIATATLALPRLVAGTNRKLHKSQIWPIGVDFVGKA